MPDQQTLNALQAESEIHLKSLRDNGGTVAWEQQLRGVQVVIEATEQFKLLVAHADMLSKDRVIEMLRMQLDLTEGLAELTQEYQRVIGESQ